MKKEKNNLLKKVIHQTIKYIFYLILVISIIYCFYFNINKLIFHQNYIQIGNFGVLIEKDDTAMKPAIKSSDLLISTKNRYMEYEENEIICYKFNDNIIIQRIHNKISDNGNIYYVTKGDNNYSNNIEIVSYNQIIGKISCKVPLLGIWINILQNEYVFLFIIISLAFNLLYKKKSIL